MSSFKRKGEAKAPTLPSYPGTRVSPASSSTIITSTGIPSLDDILGGGIPLSCSMLILAPDLHSLYGSLVQKYFIAEGLASGHRVIIVDGSPSVFANDIMWYPKSSTTPVPEDSHDGVGSDDDTQINGKSEKIKIAWRYKQMKQFQTSTQASSFFDLSMHPSASVIQAALQDGNLIYLEVTRKEQVSPATEVLRVLPDILMQNDATKVPIRICIPFLGSPSWGNLTNQELSYFLYSLRSILRKYSTTCAAVGLPPHMASETWGGAGWRQKLGWLADAAITMAAFSADPSLSATFPSHHGIVHIESLPSPHSLAPPSDRFSTLRGLSASSSASGGGGENNLAFKCTRKRLIFETLHLDLEGGISERRTTPAVASDIIQSNTGVGSVSKGPGFLTKVDVHLEPEGGNVVPTVGTESTADLKPKKKKKSVAFQSDRPDLYDF